MILCSTDQYTLYSIMSILFIQNQCLSSNNSQLVNLYDKVIFKRSYNS